MPVSNQEQSNTTVMKENISKSIKVNRCFTLYFIFAMFMGSACNPDLVGDPPMGRTEETYFSNATEFRTKLVSVYASLYDHYHFAANGWNGWVTGIYLLPGDDLTENLAARTSLELFDGGLNPTSSQMSYAFQACYKTIARANVVLDKVRSVDFSGFDDPEEIAMMEGEALFLRAYAYFKYVKEFGGVPYVTRRIQLENENNTVCSTPNEVIMYPTNISRTVIAFFRKR